jgi:hypothetical protein
MKLTFKLTKAAMELVFNTLLNQSDLFNSLEYVKKQNQLGFHVSLTVLDNSSGQYGDLLNGYILDNLGCYREIISLDQLCSFGWTTGGGSILRVDTSTRIMSITGSRTSIRDRFASMLCIGFGQEGRPMEWNWQQFDFTFKDGFALKKYETSEPEWLWYQNAHEAIRSITGRWPSQLTDKTESYLYASGLNSNQVRLVKMSA